MFKKLTCLIFIFLFAGVCLANQFDSEKVSLKAGPTEPFELLSMPWIETMLYPKNVEAGKKLSVEVNLTLKVKEIRAKIDEQKELTSLVSGNSINWSAGIGVPKNLKIGLHFLKMDIIGEDGKSISRTLAFQVRRNVEILYRQTFFRVKDVNGVESWARPEEVPDPAREFCVMAYTAFINRDYKKAVNLYENAVAIDPQDANAHYWLAKAYKKINDEAGAASELKLALQADPDHKGAKLLTDKMAQQYFREGELSLRKGNYKNAGKNFEQAVSLKPSAISELGKLYERVPQKDETTVSSQQCINIVKANRTYKGTLIDSAVRSVVSMTKSMGTQIVEDGWKTELTLQGLLVTYACRQERMGRMETENFVFKVDPDNRKVYPSNKNAKLLMMRW